MHISFTYNNSTIDNAKATIEEEKVNIDRLMEFINSRFLFNANNKNHIRKMYIAFREGKIFGRSDVQNVTGLGSTRAYELIKALLEIKVIETISGHGKGLHS